MVFMQDNAPVHTAIVVKEWLQEMAIESINWPPYSPDLNPIEHAWMRLKETIYQLDPHIESYRGTKEEIRRYFKGLIEQAWIEISQDYFNNLIESMPRRVEAVIAAQGWYNVIPNRSAIPTDPPPPIDFHHAFSAKLFKQPPCHQKRVNQVETWWSKRGGSSSQYPP
jgi:hypothetical protein